MKPTWQLQDAKSKFSEVVEAALNRGPQTVTRHGKEVVVIVSVEEYKKLVKPKKKLSDFFQSSPLNGVKIELERDHDYAREVDL